MCRKLGKEKLLSSRILKGSERKQEKDIDDVGDGEEEVKAVGGD